jgi:hypothetical protein
MTEGKVAPSPVRRVGRFALALSLSMAFSPLARAQGNASSSRADALFTQGKAALEAGDFAHACPQLQESYAIDPANGTLLALAVCHEGVGRTATAWREFRTAAEGATKDGRADRAQFARTHVAKLEARLSRLTVVVPSDAPPGLVVEVDGTALPRDEWGKASPIDPGHHTIAAHVAGRKSWTAAVDMGPDRDAQTVEVATPVAEATPTASAPAANASPTPIGASPAGAAPPVDSTVSPDGETPGAWRRPTGWIVGGLGLAAVGVGAYFGVSAITKSNDAKSQCSPSSCTSSAAVSENNDAKTAATISDVAIGAGLAVVAVGAYFLFTAPSASAPSTAVRVAPFVGRQQAGVAFEQAW